MTATASAATERWPTVVAIALAAFVAFDSGGGSQLAPILAASGFVYLGAAALRKPSIIALTKS